MTNSKANHIVRGGLYSAISLVFIYLASYIPNNKLFFSAAASCIIPIAIITIGLKNSFMVYLTVSILGLLLPNSKPIIVLYIIFFGLYGFVKYAIEKLKNLPIEIILKLCFFNTAVFAVYMISKLFITYKLPLNITLSAVIISIQIIFIIYDYALTLFIHYAAKFFKKNA